MATIVELSIGDGLTKVHFLEYRIEILQNMAGQLAKQLDAANATLKEIVDKGEVVALLPGTFAKIQFGEWCVDKARRRLGVAE